MAGQARQWPVILFDVLRLLRFDLVGSTSATTAPVTLVARRFASTCVAQRCRSMRC
jgi:hypothetical protein